MSSVSQEVFRQSLEVNDDRCAHCSLHCIEDEPLCPLKCRKCRPPRGPVRPPSCWPAVLIIPFVQSVTWTCVLLQLVIFIIKYQHPILTKNSFPVLRFSSWRKIGNPGRKYWPKGQNICCSWRICILARKKVTVKEWAVKPWHKLLVKYCSRRSLFIFTNVACVSYSALHFCSWQGNKCSHCLFPLSFVQTQCYLLKTKSLLPPYTTARADVRKPILLLPDLALRDLTEE